MCLFLIVPKVGLQYAILVLPGHTCGSGEFCYVSFSGVNRVSFIFMDTWHKPKDK